MSTTQVSPASARLWALLSRRVAAYITDIVILFTVLGAASVLLRGLLQTDAESGLSIWRTAVITFSVPSWAYFILSDRFLSGATIGKRLWGVAVISLKGPRLSWGQVLVRTPIKLIPWELSHLIFVLMQAGQTFEQGPQLLIVAANGLSLMYLVSAIATRGRRSLHDLAAGTAVTRAARRAGSTATM